MYDYSTIRVIVGVIVLLVVVLLPTKTDSGRRYALLGLCAGTVFAFLVLELIVHGGHLVVDNDDDELVKAEIDHVQSGVSAGHPTQNLLIVDGSSQSQMGLDPATVQDELRHQGYDAIVVEFAEAGANVLERYTILQRFTDEMRRKHIPYSPNTRLLMELHPTYESDPLRFFGANKQAIRSYFYSSPGNARWATHVLDIQGIEVDAAQRRILYEMYLHYLSWDLDIGFAPMLRRFDSLSGKFVYDPGIEPIGEASWHGYNPEWAVQRATRKDLIVPLNVTFDRTHQLLGLFPDGAVKEADYFLVPSLNRGFMKYGEIFCRILRNRTQPCIDGASPDILTELDARDYYVNVDHLSIRGAQVYSRYFADQLVAQGMVIK